MLLLWETNLQNIHLYFSSVKELYQVHRTGCVGVLKIEAVGQQPCSCQELLNSLVFTAAFRYALPARLLLLKQQQWGSFGVLGMDMLSG